MTGEKKVGKNRFNIIDLFLVVLILICVGIILYITVLGGDAGKLFLQKETTDVIYIVKVENMSDLMRGEVSVGNKMYDSNNGEYLGEVIDVQYSDAEEENEINMKLTLSNSATIEKNGVISLGGTALRIGEEIEFKVPLFTAKGVISSVNEVKN